VTLTLLIATAATVASAAGGSRAPSPTPSASRTPSEEAAEHYNRGLALRDKAWKLEEKAEATDDEGERAKLVSKAGKQYAKAIREFDMATRKDPGLYQAYSSLGYALRKTGDYDASLKAYDRALVIAPGYAEAIEYRAEAYLGLNRLEEAKRAYIELFGRDRARADDLMRAMQVWLDDRRSAPGEVDGATLDAFSAWLADREEIAGQTASISELKRHRW
jgi:tetratricopeptide (TPR) repeat protein